MSTLSDFGAERRQAARTTVESLTYISFGANNRGIVLDISEGGLRFRVLSPIEDTQPLHVWFSAEGNRIDAEGEVIWMDEQQVTGGLRFKSLSAENREQIRNWIAQPAASLGEGEKPVLRQLVAAVPIGKTTALGKLRSTTQLLKSKQRANAGVFARGLFSGLAVAGVVAGAILLHVERRNFGEVLIAIGQRLASRTPARPMVQAPAPGVTDDASSSNASEESAAKHAEVYHEPAVVIDGVSPSTSLPIVHSPNSTALVPPALVENKPSEPAANAAPSVETSKAEAESEAAGLAKSDAEAGGNINAGNVSAERYLDVREFRQKAAAGKMKESLVQLGFHTSVTHKGHLFLSSYHVLVGPYGSDEEVETARNDLEAHGFQPQSHARLSRKLTLPTLTLADKDTVVKDCIISWDANSSAATVSFLKGNNVVMKAQGRWVKRGVKYKLDAVLSDSKGRGPLTLLEIQCRGMDQAFVFDPSKPVQYFIPPYQADL